MPQTPAGNLRNELTSRQRSILVVLDVAEPPGFYDFTRAAEIDEAS